MNIGSTDAKGENFNDVTFITAVKIDSYDRVNNINFCVNYIVKRLKVFKHIVIEQEPNYPNVRQTVTTKSYFYFRDSTEYGFFYKTKLLNKAISFIETPFLCIYDADIYLPETAIQTSMAQLRKFEKINFVIPHTGVIFEIPNEYSLNLNLKLENILKTDVKQIHEKSNSGILLARTERIKEIGGFNENIKSWGFENDEFVSRAAIFGYPVVRPKSLFNCYHFQHTRGQDSSNINPYYRNNSREFEKIKKMSKKEIIEYKIS